MSKLSANAEKCCTSCESQGIEGNIDENGIEKDCIFTFAGGLLIIVIRDRWQYPSDRDNLRA